ncbi:MAG: ABC transporter permease [Acidobacteria bacterium]|nr:ABC transporter permease [Acidobacteriota bacterium]
MCGIATVVVAMAIGEGARRQAVAEIGALGIDNVYVRAVRVETGRAGGAPPAPALTRRHAAAIAQRTRAVAMVAATRSARAEADGGRARVTVPVLGVAPGWPAVVNLELGAGRWPADRDDRARHRVAVLGGRLARSLFPDQSAVGQTVRVQGDWYSVIGIIGQAGGQRRASALQRVDLDTAILVPLSAMDLPLGAGDAGDRVDEIAIRARGPAEAAQAARTVDGVLADLPREAYEVVRPRELLRARLRTQRTFDAVLLAIGGLALLISGVGIMNIMLAAVAERTHEIGVRRAYGARRRDVVVQFATEAALLCLAGGVVGVPVGIVLGVAVAWLAGWPVAISAWSVAVALALAIGVGLVAGIQPARLAAGLDPVAALRE